MKVFGRRTVYLVGSIILTITLLIIGFLSLGSSSNPAFKKAIGSFLVINTLFYDMTVGACAYSIAPQVSFVLKV
jgi:SP family general alpha glucoside:H+ symporter-like MFS transporter